MKAILDTHTLIWMFTKPEKLGSKASQIITNPEVSLSVSIVSFWEIVLKIKKGKLTLSDNWEKLFDREIAANNIHILNIDRKHCYYIKNLPEHHLDPFDRMIISQAIKENCVLLSKDKDVKKYKLKVIW